MRNLLLIASAALLLLTSCNGKKCWTCTQTAKGNSVNLVCINPAGCEIEYQRCDYTKDEIREIEAAGTYTNATASESIKCR